MGDTPSGEDKNDEFGGHFEDDDYTYHRKGRVSKNKFKFQCSNGKRPDPVFNKKCPAYVFKVLSVNEKGEKKVTLDKQILETKPHDAWCTNKVKEKCIYKSCLKEMENPESLPPKKAFNNFRLRSDE